MLCRASGSTILFLFWQSSWLGRPMPAGCRLGLGRRSVCGLVGCSGPSSRSLFSVCGLLMLLKLKYILPARISCGPRRTGVIMTVICIECSTREGRMPSAVPLHATFDTVASLYDEVRPGYPDAIIDAIVERLGLAAERRILETGC